jgi:MFS family permease
MKSALTRTVILLGLVSLFADISSEMLYPVTPLFLTSVLGASMMNLGFIEGLAEFVASLSKNLSGRFSDHFRRRKVFVWLGYALAAVSKPFIGSAGNWQQVLVARSMDRLGKGIRGAPRDAWLSDSVAPEWRGAAFGWHRAMDNLGAFLGPLLALLLLKIYHNDLRRIYWLALIPGLIAVFFVFVAPEGEDHAKPGATAKTNPLTKISYPKNFMTYVSVWALFSLTNSSDAFLLLKTQKEGLPLTATILLYCGFNLSTALLSPGLGQLSDRIDRKKVLIGGFLLFALVYLGFSAAHELWHFILLFSAYGCYAAATDGVGKALAVDLIPPHLKASGLGFMAMVSGLCTLVASIVAGALWDHFGAGSCFLYGALGSALAALLLFWLLPKKA